MSIFGMMRTATSGMAAQSNKLGTVSDNIANASTHGYKRAFTEFSSVVLESGGGSYIPGSVETDIRYGISQQGGFDYTTSKTDIAISGSGFLLVGDGSGSTYLTRAGSFVTMPDGSLLNAAGYQLLGYPITNGNATVAANGTGGLEPVNVSSNMTFPPSATTEATFTKLNLPFNSDPIDTTTPTNTLPSGNVDPVDPNAPMAYTQKSSLTVVNSVGTLINFDVYFSKTQNANEWEMTVFPASGADPTTGSFPYKDSTGTVIDGTTRTTTITFDPATNKIATPSPALTTFAMNEDGSGTVQVDLTAATSYDSAYEVTAEADGNAPSSFDHVEFAEDGTLSVVFENSERVALYRIPLATTPAPDNLTPVAGNAYQISADSGDLQLGFPGEGQFGTLKSSSLEKSTVDTATELTDMIEAQYSYTANSKVFQTAGELMEVLVNLKR
jgi:flagellar hook protein FlgE